MSTTTTTTTLEPATIELNPLKENDKSQPVLAQATLGSDVVDEHDNSTDKLPYLKMFSAGYSFFVAGINDGSLGPIIPYLLREYKISTGTVSLVYDVFPYNHPPHTTSTNISKATHPPAQAGSSPPSSTPISLNTSP
jgi:hypothetical protein